MPRRAAPAGALAALCALALPAAASPAAAQSAPPAAVAVEVTGRVEHPRHLGLADLQALPATSVDVAPMTGHGIEQAHFTGVPLWLLVHAAAPVDEPGAMRTYLQHVVLVRGRDGYAAAFAIGEFDPSLEGKSILVAYAQDGKALAALRLVVPLDARAARSVRDVVAIEVR